jgi:hypothetical protein
MSTKTKKTKTASESLADLAKRAGILLMSAAATTGMLELPDHPNARIMVPNQPAFAFVNEDDELNNPIRREQEETMPHYISYSVTQRTPSRSGKR